MTQVCELCSSETGVAAYEVPKAADLAANNTAWICGACSEQIESTGPLNANHWHCLNESIWTENPAVKILAWRVLKRLSSESWAQDLFDQLYLEPELLDWAQAADSSAAAETEAGTTVRDSNGTLLADGDSVTLIKDLDVKGAGFTAKRGTVVKKISLTDDPALVEGRVNGIQIVLKTCFLKKA